MLKITLIVGKVITTKIDITAVIETVVTGKMEAQPDYFYQ